MPVSRTDAGVARRGRRARTAPALAATGALMALLLAPPTTRADDAGERLGPRARGLVVAPEHGGSATLAALDRAVAEGELTWAGAARQKLLHLFEPAAVDPRYALDGGRPVRCATLVLDELAGNLERLDGAGRALYDRYVTGAGGSGTGAGSTQGGGGLETQAIVVHQTAHFYMEYNNAGPNAVPLLDVAPANGVPDFVEAAAAAMEQSWTTEVTTLGYLAPPASSATQYAGKYLVQFQAQNAYGFTQVLVGTRTKIVLHNNYLGFPPNQDPDGNVLGALRVTAAHEFKHAIQRTYSSWSEGGWVELDATWAEDVVYDAVNDYYNYISGPGSPFTEPQTPLDNDGFATTGSYEDCNWQLYQTERLGLTHMRNFWERRQLNPGEGVLPAYAGNLAASGLAFADAWGEYVAWNFASGNRAGSNGFGYGEAAGYPTVPVTSTHGTLPVPSTGGSVNRLAANLRVVVNPDQALSGQPEFTFSGNPAADWRVSVVVRTRTGEVSRFTVPLAGGSGSLLVPGVEYADLDYAALVIGNPATAGGASAYTFSAGAVAPIFVQHQKLWNQEDDATAEAVVAKVTAGTGAPNPASVQLVYRVDGGSPQVVAMTPTGQPDEYRGDIPQQAVGAVVEYRIEAQSTLGEPASSPGTAGGFFQYQVVTEFEPFEQPGAWTAGVPGDGATSGVWARVVPLGTIAQPGEDHTSAPGTTCFVTANGSVGGAAGEADVDGGATTLLSPVYDLSAGGPYASAEVRFRRWYSNGLGAAVDDQWRVDVSNDGGATWQNLETVTTGSESWVLVSDDLDARFGAIDRLRFRFVAEDLGAGSLVEAAIDDFELVAVPQAAVAVPGAAAGALALTAPRPNPAAGTAVTQLALELPAGGAVTARVLDVRGRKVRTLLAAGHVLAAGRHAVTWDGRSDAGTRVAPGLYFVEVATPFGAVQRKVLRVR